MDILDHIADYIRAELGDDIFTDARRADFLLNFRTDYGKDRPYIYSLAAITYGPLLGLFALHEAERVKRVMAAFKSQLTTREIAEREGISQRRVQQIVARTPMP